MIGNISITSFEIPNKQYAKLGIKPSKKKLARDSLQRFSIFNLQFSIFNDQFSISIPRSISELKLKEGEIAEAKWFSITEALANAVSEFDHIAIESIILQD